MIDEVDEGLRRLLHGDPVGGAAIAFAGPDADPAETQPVPAVILHLVSVTEDVAVRSTTWEEIREDGQVRWRRPAPRWYRLGYEVTARAATTADEHRLLARVLRHLSVHEVLPIECLSGSLLELGATVPVTVALPRHHAEVHDAPRHPRRLALDVGVTAPLAAAVALPAAAPPSTARISLERPGAEPERRTTPLRRSGR